MVAPRVEMPRIVVSEAPGVAGHEPFPAVLDANYRRACGGALVTTLRSAALRQGQSPPAVEGPSVVIAGQSLALSVVGHTCQSILPTSNATGRLSNGGRGEFQGGPRVDQLVQNRLVAAGHHRPREPSGQPIWLFDGSTISEIIREQGP